MRPVARGARRFLRCLLLVVCAGGILAADNTWISTISVDFVKPGHWFSSAATNDPADFSAAGNVPVEIAPKARISMSGLIHGLLFERPARRWALDSRAAETQSSLARRIVEFDQINAISGGDNFSAFKMPASFAPMVATPNRVIAAAVASPAGAGGLTGNWTQNGSGNWGNASNWAGGVIPSGANSNAHFDTLNISTNVTVTLDTSRTVGELFLGDTDGTHSYTIAPGAGTSLTFDNSPNAPSILTQSSTSAGDTISAPLVLANSLDVTNHSSNVLTLSGNISTSAPNSSFTQLSFQGGNVNVTGNINNGTDDLFVGVNGGTVVFSGTNTYLGQTSIAAELPATATLLVNGDNSAATGTVFVSGSGSLLGGTGTIGGDVFMFGESTITGATTGTVGKLTMTQDLIMATGEGAGGIYLANLSGSTSDLLAITGSLTLGLGSALDIQGAADGTTTYILATFASRMDVFEMVSGVPANYTLVYNDTDIELVPTPIPEPSTWAGGAFALAALAFTQRRRFRRRCAAR